MKMMQGAFAFPCSKRSRTRLAPTPTNISTKSEPDIEKKGRPASPAWDRAPALSAPEELAPVSALLSEVLPATDVDHFGYAEHTLTSSYLATTGGLRLRHDQPAARFELCGKTGGGSRSLTVGSLRILRRESIELAEWAISLGSGFVLVAIVWVLAARLYHREQLAASG